MKPSIYSIYGSAPEVVAYAMAKYSRSALSMKEALAQISSSQASKFLDSFYFAYGHKSIADMAHLPMAAEDISLLAAIDLLAEELWDGQERSTRFQNFKERRHFTPADLAGPLLETFEHGIDTAFSGYDQLSAKAIEHFTQEHPIPSGMAEDAYERIINARSFDIARYLLPLATLTSVGQVVSARTLEKQVCRLLSSPYPEIREVAAGLKDAATDPAFNLDTTAAPVEMAPTLVKYTAPSEFLIATREMVAEELGFVTTFLANWGSRTTDREYRTDSVEANRFTVADTGTVKLVPDAPLEIQIATSLLFEASHFTYAQIQSYFDAYPESAGLLIERILAAKERHDELPNAFKTGYPFTFEITMDIGAYRDMHRHRRCVQIAQSYRANRYVFPEPFISEEIEAIYLRALRKLSVCHKTMRLNEPIHPTNSSAANYLLPLGTEIRFLMKMDLAEVAYICKTRTQQAGHLAYRNVSWKMFQELKRKAPSVAAGLRKEMVDPNDPLDFFRR